MAAAIVVVMAGDGTLASTTFETLADLLAKHPQTGVAESTRLRAELRGQPVLAGLVGPMWGGPAHPLRYESSAAFEKLST
jgi:hypothetical protein